MIGKEHNELNRRKREGYVGSTADPESMKQIKRFREGGSEYNLVQRLSEFWLLFRLRGFAKIDIPAATGKIMDDYRPLENEQESVEMHAEDLKDFLRRAKETDTKRNDTGGGNEDILFECLDLQGLPSLKVVVKFLLNDRPMNKRLQSKNKPEIIAAITEKLEGSPNEKIDEFKRICRSFHPKIIPVEKKEKKTKERSNDQILKAAPTMAESHSLMSKVKWPENKKFPF